MVFVWHLLLFIALFIPWTLVSALADSIMAGGTFLYPLALVIMGLLGYGLGYIFWHFLGGYWAMSFIVIVFGLAANTPPVQRVSKLKRLLALGVMVLVLLASGARIVRGG